MWTGAEETKPIFCTEAQWQTSATTYGVCGKFVYDSVNNTVRLPKITGKIDGTTDVTVLGDLTPLFVKLPNITGFSNVPCSDASGSLKVGPSTTSFPGPFSTYTGLVFDASASSNVYSGNGTDTTIHEQAINVFYYIVIATSTKTDIEVDIDEIATDLNGKADTDLSNVPASKGILAESYVNGTSGYNVYSNGYCEQWGQVSDASGGVWHSVTYLKPYTSEPNIQITIKGSSYTNAGGLAYTCNAQTSTSTGFTTYIDTNIPTKNWRACGYIR